MNEYYLVSAVLTHLLPLVLLTIIIIVVRDVRKQEGVINSMPNHAGLPIRKAVRIVTEVLASFPEYVTEELFVSYEEEKGGSALIRINTMLFSQEKEDEFIELFSMKANELGFEGTYHICGHHLQACYDGVEMRKSSVKKS